MIDLQEKLQINPKAELPITAQIRQQITWLIASGELVPGDKLPPIRKLAEQFNIHMHTVRFAYQRLEADGLVSTKPGRGTIILEHDPTNIGAQSARLPTSTLGVLIPDLNPFYTPFIRGIEDACREIPALLFLSNTHDNPLLAERTLQQMIAKGVDGVILVSSGLDWEGTWSELSEELPPFVFVDEPEISQNVIQFDSEGAGYLATQHLIEHGHQNIGLITAPLDWPQPHTCYLGYHRALDEANIELSDNLIKEMPGYLPEHGAQAIEQYLMQEVQPSAIFAVADILAVGALKALKSRGMRVPEDLALIGYNDIELSSMLDPPLTSLAVPAYQAGVKAVEMLQRVQTQRNLSIDPLTLSTELVVRRSCGCNI